jgi:hypothetical protein
MKKETIKAAIKFTKTSYKNLKNFSLREYLSNKINTLFDKLGDFFAILQSAARRCFVVPTTALWSIAHIYRNVNYISIP